MKELGHPPRPQKTKRARRRDAQLDGIRNPLTWLRYRGGSRRRPVRRTP